MTFCSAGITTLVVGYDTGSTPPANAVLETIAGGDTNNVFNGELKA